MNINLPVTLPIGSSYKGIINYEHPDITIEYQKWSSQEAMYKVLVSKFELKDISEIKIYDRGIFETRIDFQMKSLKLIEGLPNIHGKIILQFKLKNKKEALVWAAYIKDKLMEMNISKIDDEIERLEKNE